MGRHTNLILKVSFLAFLTSGCGVIKAPFFGGDKNGGGQGGAGPNLSGDVGSFVDRAIALTVEFIQTKPAAGLDNPQVAKSSREFIERACRDSIGRTQPASKEEAAAILMGGCIDGSWKLEDLTVEHVAAAASRGIARALFESGGNLTPQLAVSLVSSMGMGLRGYYSYIPDAKYGYLALLTAGFTVGLGEFSTTPQSQMEQIIHDSAAAMLASVLEVVDRPEVPAMLETGTMVFVQVLAGNVTPHGRGGMSPVTYFLDMNSDKLFRFSFAFIAGIRDEIIRVGFDSPSFLLSQRGLAGGLAIGLINSGVPRDEADSEAMKVLGHALGLSGITIQPQSDQPGYGYAGYYLIRDGLVLATDVPFCAIPGDMDRYRSEPTTLRGPSGDSAEAEIFYIFKTGQEWKNCSLGSRFESVFSPLPTFKNRIADSPKNTDNGSPTPDGISGGGGENTGGADTLPEDGTGQGGAGGTVEPEGNHNPVEPPKPIGGGQNSAGALMEAPGALTGFEAIFNQYSSTMGINLSSLSIFPYKPKYAELVTYTLCAEEDNTCESEVHSYRFEINPALGSGSGTLEEKSPHMFEGRGAPLLVGSTNTRREVISGLYIVFDTPEEVGILMHTYFNIDGQWNFERGEADGTVSYTPLASPQLTPGYIDVDFSPLP